jgi:hypothetical protein
MYSQYVGGVQSILKSNTKAVLQRLVRSPDNKMVWGLFKHHLGPYRKELIDLMMRETLWAPSARLTHRIIKYVKRNAPNNIERTSDYKWYFDGPMGSSTDNNDPPRQCNLVDLARVHNWAPALVTEFPLARGTIPIVQLYARPALTVAQLDTAVMAEWHVRMTPKALARIETQPYFSLTNLAQENGLTPDDVALYTRLFQRSDVRMGELSVFCNIVRTTTIGKLSHPLESGGGGGDEDDGERKSVHQKLQSSSSSTTSYIPSIAQCIIS